MPGPACASPLVITAHLPLIQYASVPVDRTEGKCREGNNIVSVAGRGVAGIDVLSDFRSQVMASPVS